MRTISSLSHEMKKENGRVGCNGAWVMKAPILL